MFPITVNLLFGPFTFTKSDSKVCGINKERLVNISYSTSSSIRNATPPPQFTLELLFLRLNSILL